MHIFLPTVSQKQAVNKKIAWELLHLPELRLWKDPIKSNMQ